MKKRGFTLIEILVVIAIINILVAMILVLTRESRQRARVAAGKGSLASIPAAIAMCRNENKDVKSPGKDLSNPDNINICLDSAVTDAKYPGLLTSRWNYGGLVSDYMTNPQPPDQSTILAYCGKKDCGQAVTSKESLPWYLAGKQGDHLAVCCSGGCQFYD